MIKINDQLYDANVVTGKDGSMSVTFKGTKENMASIEALFASALKIEIVENSETVAVYYNKEISSLSAKRDGYLYDVTIFLRVSKVNTPEEQILQEQIDNVKKSITSIKESNNITNDAVSELGAFSADNQSDIETLNKTVNKLNSFLTDNKNVIDLLSDAIDDLANTVADIIAANETVMPDAGTTDTTTEETNSTTEKGETING